MRRIPKFNSIKAEREFWDTHDAIEIFGEKGWKISEPGATSVKSVYVAKVGTRGALIHWTAGVANLDWCEEGPKDQSPGAGQASRDGVSLIIARTNYKMFNPFRFTDFPNAIKNITLLPVAWGEKNSVTSSSKNVSPEAPRRWA